MPLFTVMRRGEEPVSIEADNWIVAMGTGIAQLGGDIAIDRLACEMLANGTVIARDVRTGTGYVILPSKEAVVKPTVSEADMPMEAPEDDFDDLLDVVDEPDPSLDETIDFSAEDYITYKVTACRADGTGETDGPTRTICHATRIYKERYLHQIRASSQVVKTMAEL